MFTKYASAELLGHSGKVKGKIAGKSRLGSFDYEPRTDHKYLYVAARACTADVPNLNYDMLPSSELKGKEAYRTFVGSYVYLNHDNTDPRKARGAIIDAKYHDEDDEEWVEILMELDEEKCPKLCSLIRSGEIDTFSMGCNIESSTCSVCGNVAEYPFEYCDHIKRKGVEYDGKLAYEICNGIEFFEESVVYNPADPTAMTQAIGKTASRKTSMNKKSAYVFSDEVKELASRLSGKIDVYSDEFEYYAGHNWIEPFYESYESWSGFEITIYFDGSPIIQIGYDDRSGDNPIDEYDEYSYIEDCMSSVLGEEDFDEFFLCVAENVLTYYEEVTPGVIADDIESSIYDRRYSIKKFACACDVERNVDAKIGKKIADMPTGYARFSNGVSVCVIGDEDVFEVEIDAPNGYKVYRHEDVPFTFAPSLISEYVFGDVLEWTGENVPLEDYDKVRSMQDEFLNRYVSLAANGKSASYMVIDPNDWDPSENFGFTMEYGTVLDDELLRAILTEPYYGGYSMYDGWVEVENEDGNFDAVSLDDYIESLERYQFIEKVGSRKVVCVTAADDDEKTDSYANAPRKPEPVPTERDDEPCPLCGSDNFDGEYCNVCGYQVPPEGFDDIKLEDDSDYDEYEEESEEDGFDGVGEEQDESEDESGEDDFWFDDDDDETEEPEDESDDEQEEDEDEDSDDDFLLGDDDDEENDKKAFFAFW